MRFLDNFYHVSRFVTLLACAGLLSSCVSTPEIGSSYNPYSLPEFEYDPPEVSLSDVKPPEKPLVDNTYHLAFSTERELDDFWATLPPVAQPSQLKEILEALTQNPIGARVELLRKKALKDLVFVRGGRFVMGDWGYIKDANAHPQHPVVLTSFYISRYMVTYAEFDTYTDATGTPRTAEKTVPDRENRHSLVPAGATWQRARDYCQWVGQITGLPFDLPTEAQWEYAARSCGQLFVFPTDDGNVRRGLNVPVTGQESRLHPLQPAIALYPVGMFPPNPLGLYDMAHNGTEWVLDWYDAEYYKYSPLSDPKGPETGTRKVKRSIPIGESPGFYGISAGRRAADPELMGVREQGSLLNSGLRCVVNTDLSLSGPEHFQHIPGFAH
jgi:formylglycine-generating enzyme required for sulfatase activity